METDVILIPTDVICRECGKLFRTNGTTLPFGRGPITPNVCEPCIEEHVRSVKMASHSAQQQRKEERWAALCPLIFRLPSETGGLTDLALMSKASPKWTDVLKYKWNHKGQLVYGSTGRCKTRAQWRLFRRFFDEGRSIAFHTAVEFDRACRDAAGTFVLTKWFEGLARVDALFIDDIGKATWSPASEAQFFDLLDKRTREGRPVFTTTNDDGESLGNRMSDRVGPMVRRLKEFCPCITL